MLSYKVFIVLALVVLLSHMVLEMTVRLLLMLLRQLGRGLRAGAVWLGRCLQETTSKTLDRLSPRRRREKEREAFINSYYIRAFEPIDEQDVAESERWLEDLKRWMNTDNPTLK